MNGDILTNLNFEQFLTPMLNLKIKYQFSYAREVKIDFGVLGFEKDLN